MNISEIFYSSQGEGPETGKKAIFIRLGGCNLRCKFCDTKYAYRGKMLQREKIINIIKSYPCKHIIWTGGEPTLQINDIIKLIAKLKDYSYNIETNGTNYFPIRLFHKSIISPKKQMLNIRLIKEYKDYDNVYFKFVIENKKNYEFWKRLVEKLGIKRDKSFFMPEAKNLKSLNEKSKWLVAKCKKDRFNFSNRLHILNNLK